MSTLNAPPDQIDHLSLGGFDTLNVGKGGTVSNVVDEGVINVNGGAANGTNIDGGTLNLNDGTISGTNVLGNLNINGGTAIDTHLHFAGTFNISGTVDGITFEGGEGEGEPPKYILKLKDFNSLQGTLGFNDQGPPYDVVFDFQNVTLSNVTMTANTITIDYGKNQSVTYKYTSLALVSGVHVDGNELFITVRGIPALAFSAKSAGTIVYTAEFGIAPSATELTILNQFTQAQFDYGQKIGVMDPSVYAFQALGVALASGPHFQDTFGPTNVLYPVSSVGDVHFVDDSYASVFGHAGTAAQVQHFVDQLDSFEALYTAAGTFASASNIDLLARGAVYGQMLGIEHESGLIGEPAPSPIFNLTTSQDTIVLTESGSIVNGTFGGAGATWTTGDEIICTTTDATFNIQGIGAAGIIDVTSVLHNHVFGVQNVKVTANSGQVVHGDFTSTGPEGDWNDLAILTVTSQGNNAGVDNLTVDPNTAVQIMDTISTTATSEALTVNGGSTISINERNETSNAGIDVNGGSGTTAVTIKQIEDDVGLDGVVNIVDVNGTSNTDAGTIKNITLDGLAGTANSIVDNSLTELTINNSEFLGGRAVPAGLSINDNLTTPTATTLALNLSHDGVNAAGTGLAFLEITDTNNEYSTVHLTLGSENSTLSFIDNGLTTLDTPNAGTGAIVGVGQLGASGFQDNVEAAVHFDFSGLNGPNDIAVDREGSGSNADVYTLGNFGTDNGFFNTNNTIFYQQLTIHNDAVDSTATINFGSGAYLITGSPHPDNLYNYVQTAPNGAALANLNGGAQWAIISSVNSGAANGDTLMFKTDNVKAFVNLGDLTDPSISLIAEVAGGINKALNTAAHTAVSFTIERANTFIFDHADASSDLTAADAMVEIVGNLNIAAVSNTHEITFI